MAVQLPLIETTQGDDDFRLDAHTREIGRRGIAEVRRILSEIAQAAADAEAGRPQAA